MASAWPAYLMALGRAMRDAGGHAGIRSMDAFTGADGWFDNPIAYEEASRAAEHILAALRPVIDPAAAGVVDPAAAEGLGVLFAKGVLRVLSNPEVGGEIGSGQPALDLFLVLPPRDYPMTGTPSL